jgi:hypothetical protein
MLSQVKKSFKKLPLIKKATFFSSLALAFSVFLPWYSDLNAFNIGTKFTGVTGPLYFLGLSIFLLSSANLLLIGLEKDTKFDVKNLTALPLILLFFVFTIYIHKDFGVNLENKQILFGYKGAVLFALTAFALTFAQKPEKKIEVKQMKPEDFENAIEIKPEVPFNDDRRITRSSTIKEAIEAQEAHILDDNIHI